MVVKYCAQSLSLYAVAQSAGTINVEGEAILSKDKPPNIGGVRALQVTSAKEEQE